MAVQGQGGVVAGLGIDDDLIYVQASQPVKAIEEQPLAEAFALRLREDGKSLDETTPSGSATDGVPFDPAPHTKDNPQTALRGCP